MMSSLVFGPILLFALGELQSIWDRAYVCHNMTAEHSADLIQTRSKVLIAAFTRSIRDPFTHARAAGLLAFAATIDYFTEEDCAGKILPAICPALLDKEK